MKALRCVAMVVAMAAAVGGGLGEERSAEKKVEWKSLFNGKDLDGWKASNTDAIWKVEDGCLMGTQTTGKGGDLFTTDQWDNFELRFTYKVAWPANTGIWYRTDPARAAGYQFDILKWKSPATFSGALYFPGCKTTFAFTNLEESIENRDDWNEGVVYANGDRLIHWLNGKMIGEARDKTFAKGSVGIQVHPGDGFKNMKILVKKIEIRPLAAGDKPSLPTTAPATQPAGK
jgi:hypothetical protein